MNRFLCNVVGACLAGSASIAVADSNQMSTTQPTTQPLLGGRVITQDAALPTTMPSGKPTAYIPPTNTADGGGNKAGGMLLNGGIGATVVPSSNGGTATAPLPGGNESASMRSSTTQPAR